MLLGLSSFGQSIINSDWIDAPFGLYENSYPGGSTFNSGTYTVIGSGYNMWGWSEDGGRFVSIPVSGDCDITAFVQKPVEDNLNYNARAGIMIRETNDRGAKYISMLRLRGDSSNEGRIQSNSRIDYNNNPVTVSSNGYTDDWLKLRIIRQGDTFTTYVLTGVVDTVWVPYRVETVELDESLSAGIFVSVYTSSTADLMTNDFQEVAVNPIVDVQTNAADGAEITWLTDLPYLPTNTCQYSYSIIRTELDGSETVLASDLTAPAYTDSSITKGIHYKYSLSAKELPYLPQAATQTVHVGTSGIFRYQAADTNLITGVAAGLTASYYEADTSTLPYDIQTVTSLADILSPTGGETTYYKSVLNASIHVENTDVYTFLLDFEDRANLYIDGKPVINNWFDGNRLTTSTPVKLEKGRAHAFRVEFYFGTGTAKCDLSWSRTGNPAIVDVPDSIFTPVTADWMTVGIGDVKLNGDAIFDEVNDTIAITACGSELTNTVDSGRVVLGAARYAFDLTTCLTSLTSSASAPLAGLTARAEAAFDAASVSLLVVGGGANHSLIAVLRGSQGDQPLFAEYATSIAATDPICLNITGDGNSYTLAYREESATEWTVIETLTGVLGFALQCGLITSSGDLNTPATAQFTGTLLTSYAETEIEPTDDTYVKSDNTFYGNSIEIVLKHRGTETQREGLLRFDVKGFSNVRRAILRMTIRSRDSSYPDQDVNVRGFHNMEWSEDTLVWDTPPAGIKFPTVFLDKTDPTLIARVPTHYPMEIIEVDVTDFVKESVAGTGDLTFTLSATVTIDPGFAFYSKEESGASRRPHLLIITDSPQNLAAVGGAETGEIDLDWTDYAGALTYNIYRAADEAGPYSLLQSGVTGISYSDSSLTQGATYFYKITAITAAGESELSEAVQASASDNSTSLIAVEDTHVEGGTKADTKYYNNTAMTVKSNYGDYYYHREAYMKFDGIAGLAHVQKAILKVTPGTADGGGYDPSVIDVNFIRMPSNNWDETTVTFNNYPPGYPPPTPKDSGAPASDRVTAYATPANTTMEVDITEIVRKAAVVNSDGKLSIGALRLDTKGGFNLAFHSINQTTVAYKPTIVYSMGRPRLPAPDLSAFYPDLDWEYYLNAASYNIYRAESKDGSYTLMTNTTATAFKDLATVCGKTYFYKLAAIVSGAETELSLPVVAAMQNFEDRYPVADTYVESNGGSTADTNHGTETTLNLKYSPLREQLFKFDIRGLQNIEQARFRINPNPPSTGYTPVNILLWKGHYGDWNEYTTTYNRYPFNYLPHQSEVSNFLGKVTVEYRDPGGQLNFAEVDVTDAVRDAAAAGETYLTFIYTGDAATPDGQGFMSTSTKEHADIYKRPVLTCSGTTFSAPVLRGESAITPTSSGVELNWRSVSGADHYVITRTAPGETTATIIVDDLTAATYTDTSAAFRNSGEYTYTVTAVNADGSSSEPSSVTVEMDRTMKQPVLADTFVRSGESSNDVYGANAALEVKRDSESSLSDYNREAILRIGVTNTPAFERAYLRTVLRATNVFTDVDVYLIETADTGWTEGDASWRTMMGDDSTPTPVPALNDPALLDSFNLFDEGYGLGSEILFDITANLRAAQTRGADTFVMQLFNGTVSSSSNYSLYSKENSNHEIMPYVIFTVLKYPPGATVIIVR